MNINILKCVSMVVTIALIGLNLRAANVDVNTARITANGFLKHINQPGSINSPALADIKLAHAEASSIKSNANAYYAFNINGGGFIIVSGDNRASQVLGYSDKGQFDFKHLPDNMKALLDIYKEEIEYLQANPRLKVPKRTSSNNREVIVEPLVTAKWGQQMPYYLQCPMSNGSYSKVGCSGVQMAQIVHYWQYPTTCGSIPAYYCPKLGITLEELPVTTFDYSKMLTSYCHWDTHQRILIQDTYTEEQANEAAKLCRYVGQAARMNYSVTGSGTDATRKLAAMKILGYNSDAISVYRDNGYTTEVWESLMRDELDAGQPIMYGAKNGTGDIGHGFIFDGYDSEGYFHINWGWYGVNDGWFLTTALITTYYSSGDPRNYSKDQYMFLYMRPEFYCNVNAQSIILNDGFFLLGSSLNIRATDVNINTSYNAVDLMFTITDSNGNIVAASDTINVLKSEFSQHSDINCAILLPASLAEGTYNLQFNYIIDDALNTVVTTQGELSVVGRLAKFNSAFIMDDLSQLINVLLIDVDTQFDMDDLAQLINCMLTH